tara:strand:+ start:142 stop:771 length:630 start_codon:yes stop_codon:yes gene_type:complete
MYDLNVLDLFDGLIRSSRILGLALAFFTMIIGFLNCFFGYRLFKILIMLLGFIVGFTVGTILTESILQGIALGIFSGALAYFLYYFGVFLIGALAGLFLYILFQAFVFEIMPLALLLVIGGGILALIYQKLLITFSTSVTGAFSIIQGIQLLFYGLFFTALSPPFFILGLLVIFLTVIGFSYQYKWLTVEKGADNKFKLNFEVNLKDLI